MNKTCYDSLASRERALKKLKKKKKSSIDILQYKVEEKGK